MISKASKTKESSAEAFIDNLCREVFNGTIETEGEHLIDKRRRLEDRLEEMQLRREMREFDFEIDG